MTVALSERLTALRAAVWVALVTTVILVPARGLAPYPTVSLGRVGDWLLETIPGLGRFRGGAAVETVGFNPDTRRLGGPVAAGHAVAMQVRIARAEVRPSPVRPYRPQRLYLRGTVRDWYTGQGWRSGLPRFTFPPPVDEMTWLKWLAEDAHASWLDVEMEVRPRDLPYLYLFTPWIPMEVEREGTTLATLDGEISAARQPGEYTVRARVPLHSAQELSVWRPMDSHRLARYLRVPDELPPAVEQQARRVAAGARTPYEQAVRVEEYLRTTFPYDTRVRRPGRDKDFVADFLFDLKKGYCVHHSTAMAVMLRTLGIPTRWVQGFVVDLKTDTWMDVPQSTAHAWVEVLIPGCGWVTFDPTPRFSLPWRTFTPVPGDGGSPGRPGEEPPPETGVRPGRPEREPEPEQPGDAGYLPQPAGREFPWWLPLVVIASLGVALPGGRSLFRLAWLRGAYRRGREEPIAAFIVRQYRLAEHYLGLIGLRRPSWLTPREFLREFRARSGERGIYPTKEVCRALAALTAGTEEAAFSPRRGAVPSVGRAFPVIEEALPAEEASRVGWVFRAAGRGAPPGAVRGRDGAAEAVRHALLVATWARRHLGLWGWLRWLALGPPLPPALTRHPSGGAGGDAGAAGESHAGDSPPMRSDGA